MRITSSHCICNKTRVKNVFHLKYVNELLDMCQCGKMTEHSPIFFISSQPTKNLPQIRSSMSTRYGWSNPCETSFESCVVHLKNYN